LNVPSQRVPTSWLIISNLFNQKQFKEAATGRVFCNFKRRERKRRRRDLIVIILFVTFYLVSGEDFVSAAEIGSLITGPMNQCGRPGDRNFKFFILCN